MAIGDNTGPQYPPPPGPGTNAIGEFQIGVSPVGDIPEFNVWNTVMSQYANSPALTGMITSLAAAADQTQNFDTWYDDVWNIDTALDYGLDIWGRIVGVNRVLQIPSVSFFGFHEALPGSLSWDTNAKAALSPALGFAEAQSWQPFGFGTFGLNWNWSTSRQNEGGGAYYSGHGLTLNYRLDTESYRHLILAKAAQNLTDCSIPSINQILLNLFPNRGNAYVTDGYQGPTYFGFAESQNAQTFGQQGFYNGEAIPTMVMSYTFKFPLSPVELAIVQQSGVLPKPTGVLASVVINA